MREALIGFVGVVLLLGLSTGTFAQEGNGAVLSGTVSHSTGAPISGALVTATNDTTGAATTRMTNAAGAFEFTDLSPGLYTLTAEKLDFQVGVHAGVELRAEEPVLLDFSLEVVVTMTVTVGTRAQPRSVTESTVPIDAINAEELGRQGVIDLREQLRTLVPSFNVNTQPISDSSTIVRPTTLRNLAPDHTLLLVNGKRRHRSSVINWIAQAVAFGSQGPDISSIPSIALRQIEVLRDGAAAQYGSDAIAGVINLLPRDNRSGARLELTTGAYHQGLDGKAYTVAGNVGLPLGETGFANLSLEYGSTNPTDRSIQRTDVVGLIAGGNTSVRDPAQIWGSPEIDGDLKLFGNFGYLLGDDLQLYGHTNYASKKVTGGFYFRNPNTRGGVFSLDGGQSLLIGDVLAARGEGTADCPTVRITDHVPDPDALARVFSDPNCFSFQERFPGGFTPNFGGDATDSSVVGGLRGLTDSGLTWDASFSVGAHEVDLFIFDTVNASLGPATPTEFDLGKNRQQEMSVNLDVSYAVNDRINIAGGAEWRHEQFESRLGQRESWESGPYAAQGFTVGSNGFSGYSPLVAGKWGRNSIGAYGDVEFSGLDNRWIIGTAARIENFEGFGTTLNGKLSGRYRLLDALSLRASVSTGFRAPTPGQQNTFNLSTVFVPTLNDLVERGTIPSTSPIARLRNGRPLEPEESVNYTIGAVVEKGPLVFTADYFNIDLSDRLAVTQDFTLTPEEVDQLVREGVENARSLSSFRFFTNEISTTTEGIDLVFSYAPSRFDGNTVFGAVFNHTETRVTQFNPELLDVARRVRELQEALPENRWNVSVNQKFGRFDILGRVNYYGAWYDWDSSEVQFSGKPVFDIEVGVPLSEQTQLSFGSQNVFDTFPDTATYARNVGERYSEFTPWGFNGAYYYIRLGYSWDSSAN